MKEFGVSNIVFSSSATVYGSPDYLPIDEKHPAGQNLTNCYGRTKYFLEQILTDVYSAEKVNVKDELNVFLIANLISNLQSKMKDIISNHTGW